MILPEGKTQKIHKWLIFTFLSNLSGEYNSFEEWDAAEEREMEKKREKPPEKRHKELTAEELKMIEEEKDQINTK